MHSGAALRHVFGKNVADALLSPGTKLLAKDSKPMKRPPGSTGPRSVVGLIALRSRLPVPGQR